MRTVWKYPLTDRVSMSLAAPKVVHVGPDPTGVESVWIEHSTDANRPVSMIELLIVGTGMPIPDGYSHVQSWVSGSFVWHLYQRPAP